jgi:hypothetical protein
MAQVGRWLHAAKADGTQPSARAAAPFLGERPLRLDLKTDDEHRSRPSIPVHIDWATELTRTRTAATVEVDVMPFLGRTEWGGPFDKYYAGLLTQGVPGVPQDPFAPPPGPRVPSPDSLKRTENPPGIPDFGLRDLWLSESYHPRYYEALENLGAEFVRMVPLALGVKVILTPPCIFP